MNKVPMQLLVDSKDQTATLTIYGDITSWVWDESETSSVDVAKALNGLPGNVTDICVRLNSYGGEVAEGLAIYNALKSCGKRVTTVCDGFACSIASVIFTAGDRRIMHGASALMIHNPWTFVQGNPDELRKQADDLEKIAQLSRDAYASVTVLTADEIAQMMDEETWITPKEALDMGFATEVDEDQLEGPNQAVLAEMVEKLCCKPKEQAVKITLDPAQLEEIAQKTVERFQSKIVAPDDGELPSVDGEDPATPSESFIQKLNRISVTE